MLKNRLVARFCSIVIIYIFSSCT